MNLLLVLEAYHIFVKIDEIEDLFKCTSMSNEDDINKYLSLNDKILERILEEKDKKYKDVKEIVRRIYSEDYYTFLGDFINKIDNLDENYSQSVWKCFTDKSSPLNIFSKIVYHKNGVLIPDKSMNIYRLYKKDKNR